MPSVPQPDSSETLEYARQVLSAEARAIVSLQERLSDTFVQAARWILQLGPAGRVVVSGMGKAGIVGQKIAATFASTGTPALFMHPAEAVHGDLGMATSEDIALAVSNSGESEELVRLLPTLKRIGCRIIALTASKNSSVGKHANLVLEIGQIEEPCPLRMAPSASTTALLAMGDALALSVLRARGFTREDFARLHPAGSLGRALLPVTAEMRTPERMVLVQRGVSVRDALALMAQPPRNGAAVVVDAEGKLAGIFTHGDFGRLAVQNPATIAEAIGSHMTAPCRFVRADMLIADAQRLMQERRINALPVVDEALRVLGLLDVQDLV